MICPADSPSPTPGKPVKLTLVANVDRRSPSGERPHPFVSSVSARASSLFGDGCMAGGGIYAFWHIGPVLDAGGGRSHSSVDCFCVVAAHLALQLPYLKISESMGNHDSKIVDAASVD